MNMKLKWLLALLFAGLNLPSTFAQSKQDIFDGKTPITWLGLDYTQAKYVGLDTTKGITAPVFTEQFIKVYVPAWNYLFMTEQKKYNVAKATHRANVAYALSVTEKANSALTGNIVATKGAGFKTLAEQDISELVKRYDFQGKTGIGLLFFIADMDKDKKEEGAWVTFVDMKEKTVLLTLYATGKTGGMGFRNNWADATFDILKQIEAYPHWAK